MKTTKSDLQGKLRYCNKMIESWGKDYDALRYCLVMLEKRRDEAESMSLVEGQLYKDDWKREQERMEEFICSLSTLQSKCVTEQGKWCDTAEKYELMLKEYDHE